MDTYPHLDPRLALLGQLKREHQQLDERLEQLNRYSYHTAEEQLELRRIKKLKLLKKEQIQNLAYQGAGSRP